MTKGPINLTENVVEATPKVQAELAYTPFVRLERLFDEPENVVLTERLLSKRFWD
jgi:hypothetical protein